MTDILFFVIIVLVGIVCCPIAYFIYRGFVSLLNKIFGVSDNDAGVIYRSDGKGNIVMQRRDKMKRKRCKYLYADWCHNPVLLKVKPQELCPFYHHQEECNYFIEG